MNAQIEKLAKQIRLELPTHDTPKQAAEAVKAFIESLGFPFDGTMQRNLDLALEQVVASLEGVEILRRNSLTKPRDDWYQGPDAHDLHWPALHMYLENTKGWDPDTVLSIDESSTEVVSLLANPSNEQFRCRGLVVGYVQSGKTANMTAVIAKAVDSGYNLIVLLGGVTNKLRAQTQRRLEADIVARHSTLWQLYTTDADEGDFNIPANRSFTMPVPGRAQLVVMKKITSRLEAFGRTIDKTPPAILKSLKVLLIDDECDQASVNSSKSDYDMTRINEEIRKIVRSLPAISYVGYTATPFANVFIDPFPHNKDELDDLYPEDFITALPRPDGYFGAKEVFGIEPENADEETKEEAGRDMIRLIPGEELDRLCPVRASEKDSFHPLMTVKLEEAIMWYLASCAIRRARGQSDKHMTMLVHTSPNIIQHTRMAGDVIRAWIELHKDDLAVGRGEVFERLRQVFNKEIGKVTLDKSHNTWEGDLDALLPYLAEVLDVLEVAVENGESFERLDYTEEPKTYIVVGGSVLARGLTLEGLSVSFFLRTSRQYDTLLQMGRWFGYRHGYEDLPRLWTTADLAANFRSLARIEEEIREDIAAYKAKNATPLDFALKVRSIPGMAITSATKMKHAYRTSISFEGRHIQTIRFDHRADDIVRGNWKAASCLVDEALSEERICEPQVGRSLIKAVPYRMIRKFMMAYSICNQHMDLRKDMLLGYLDKAEAHLPFWNVGIIKPESGKLSVAALGSLGQVKLNQRSKLKLDGKDYADIKALMSKRDILIDVSDARSVQSGIKWAELKSLRPAVPLLLLYPIDKDSRPQAESDSRIELGAVGDLIGFGIVFPGTPDRSGDYYSVELDAPTPEQIDEEELGLESDAVAVVIDE